MRLPRLAGFARTYACAASLFLATVVPAVVASFIAGVTASASGCATTLRTNSDGGPGSGADAEVDLLTPGSCSIRTVCEGGAKCVNGLCHMGCTKEADCPASQFCDTGDYLCHDKTVTSCPATPCATSQICVNGLCSTPPSGMACGRSPFSMVDGCGHNAVCLADALIDGKRSAAATCYGFPDCPPNGMCPLNSVCNDTIFPDKGHFCLGGLCKAKPDCQQGFDCVYVTDLSVKYGACTDGTPGSVCARPENCISLTCMQGNSQLFGICK